MSLATPAGSPSAHGGRLETGLGQDVEDDSASWSRNAHHLEEVSCGAEERNPIEDFMGHNEVHAVVGCRAKTAAGCRLSDYVVCLGQIR